MLENLYYLGEVFLEVLSNWIGGIVRAKDKVPQLARYKAALDKF
jgi:hypothetical protein